MLTRNDSTLTLPPIDVLAAAAGELATAAQDAGDTTNMHALNKAAQHFHDGDIIITPTHGGFLIPSGTRGGIVHRVSNVYGCSCEAGRNRRQCWHMSALEIIELAQTRTMPVVTPRSQAYEEALAELMECF